MSTGERKKQIDELLRQLRVESLSRSHNSVNISFKQMLGYIDKVIEPNPLDDVVDPKDPLPPDIKTLLETYRSMAEAFFTQFEHSLLTEIKKRRDIQEDASFAVKYIKGLRAKSPAKAALERASPILVEDHDIAGAEYGKLIENFPTLLQTALDKLRDEWQRLNAFTTARQRLTENEKLDRSLKAVVEVAAHSIGIEAERIVVVPGNTFALYFFTYLDNFAVLTVPIYSVQSPWEWSIFWHELAGYKVRRLEKNATIETIRDKLIAFHDVYKNTSKSEKREELLNAVVWDNPYSQMYIRDVFSRQRPLLDDLGGFEHQFERILLNLPTTQQFQIYDEIREVGWCVDWFKELFEDAWSVLAIGEPFLDFFSDVLSRHAAKDNRHPPLKVRLSVAKELLNLVNPKSRIENKPEPVEVFAAQQILNFMSLLRVAARRYKNPNVRSSTDYYFLWQSVRDEVLIKVRDSIRLSIKNWSEKLLNTENPMRRVTNIAKSFLEILSDPALERLLSQLPQRIIPNKSSYKGLLQDGDGNPKGYEQLLEISFYDTDFGLSGTTYTITYNGDSYSITETALNRWTGTFIFTSEVQNSKKVLTLGSISYWTTGPNIERMKVDHVIS